MKRLGLAGIAALLGLVMLGVSWAHRPVTAYQDANEARFQGWEYNVVQEVPNAAEFQRLGRQGWEFGGTLAMPGRIPLIVFKRPSVGDPNFYPPTSREEPEFEASSKSRIPEDIVPSDIIESSPSAKVRAQPVPINPVPPPSVD